MSLKNRLIACLIVKNGFVVQSVGFSRYLPVGSIEVAVEFLNEWGVDEIVLLDIDAARNRSGPDPELVSKASASGLVPITFGGGIRSVDDMRIVLRSGADKIAMNSAVIEQPSIVSQGALVFGNQCMVVSIDVKLDSDNYYRLYSASTDSLTALDPFDHARRLEKLGAGEILLNSVDKDGTKSGYDLDLVTMMTEAVNIPLIVCGGVGHPKHFVEGFKSGKVSGVAAANFFHFTEHSVVTAKSYLARNGNDIRLDTYSKYQDTEFDYQGRVEKKTDEALSELIFERVPKEVI